MCTKQIQFCQCPLSLYHAVYPFLSDASSAIPLLQPRITNYMQTLVLNNVSFVSFQLSDPKRADRGWAFLGISSSAASFHFVRLLGSCETSKRHENDPMECHSYDMSLQQRNVKNVLSWPFFFSQTKRRLPSFRGSNKLHLFIIRVSASQVCKAQRIKSGLSFLLHFSLISSK